MTRNCPTILNRNRLRRFSAQPTSGRSCPSRCPRRSSRPSGTRRGALAAALRLQPVASQPQSKLLRRSLFDPPCLGASRQAHIIAPWWPCAAEAVAICALWRTVARSFPHHSFPRPLRPLRSGVRPGRKGEGGQGGREGRRGGAGQERGGQGGALRAQRHAPCRPSAPLLRKARAAPPPAPHAAPTPLPSSPPPSTLSAQGGAHAGGGARARRRGPPAHADGGSGLQQGLLLHAVVPHRVRAAPGGDVRVRHEQRVHVRPDVQGGEQQHGARARRATPARQTPALGAPRVSDGREASAGASWARALGEIDCLASGEGC